MSVVTSKDIKILEDITSEKFNPLQDRNEIIQNLVKKNNELKEYNITLKETIRFLKSKALESEVPQEEYDVQSQCL